MGVYDIYGNLVNIVFICRWQYVWLKISFLVKKRRMNIGYATNILLAIQISVSTFSPYIGLLVSLYGS